MPASLLFPLLLAWPAAALAPNASTYQGRLQESGLPVSGARQVELRLCTGLLVGTCYSAGSQGVGVLNGVFKTTFTIPVGVDLSAGSWFLEVAVGPFGGALNTLAPREALTSFPYAVHASSATTLLGTILPAQVSAGLLDTGVVAQSFPVGGIPTAALAGSAVTTAKLADASVETAKLAVASVDSTKIAAQAVDTTKLAPASVDSTKIAAGAVDTRRLASDSVDSFKILNGSVTNPKLAPGAVDTPKLETAAVTTAKLLDGAVTTPKLAPLSVDASRLASSAVTGVKLATLSVDTTKIAPDAITTSAIISFAVTLNKLASNSVDTGKLTTDSVTSGAILNGSVGTLKISLGAIDTGRLNRSAVTGEKLATGALMVGGRGIDRLGAMTRMASGTAFGSVSLNIGGRRHFEYFAHVPPLVSPTDVRIQFNTLPPGSYSVTRSTGSGTYSSVSQPGIDLLGTPFSLPALSQVHIRLTVDGNSGSPSFVTGSFTATAFQNASVAPVQITGSFGVNTGGETITDVSILGVSASLPSGTYAAAYGEEFP